MDTGFIPKFINHFGVKIRYSTASAGNSLRGVRMFRRRQPCYAGVPGERRFVLGGYVGCLVVETLLQKKLFVGNLEETLIFCLVVEGLLLFLFGICFDIN